MMSESKEPVDRSEASAVDPADLVEGSYTEVDGEAPHERTVAGAYTRTNGAPDDESVVGDYVSTEEHPKTHDPAERHGKYVRTERPTPHPGPHKV
jgi:hypothetical protein